VARMIEILARGKWLPQLRRYEAAMPTEIPLDTIDNVLSHVADAAQMLGGQSQYLQRPLPHAARRHAQEAIARAYPPTEITLRQLQHIAPDGLNLALIRCEDSGG
jgi:hypothetical protein